MAIGLEFISTRSRKFFFYNLTSRLSHELYYLFEFQFFVPLEILLFRDRVSENDWKNFKSKATQGDGDPMDWQSSRGGVKRESRFSRAISGTIFL
jgi:hypothetical protein